MPQETGFNHAETYTPSDLAKDVHILQDTPENETSDLMVLATMIGNVSCRHCRGLDRNLFLSLIQSQLMGQGSRSFRGF